MYSVGCDLHKKTITLHSLDPAHKTAGSTRLACSDPAGIVQWLTRYRPFAIVVEATASYEWFVRLVEPLAERVVLAHPGKSPRRLDQASCGSSRRAPGRATSWMRRCWPSSWPWT